MILSLLSRSKFRNCQLISSALLSGCLSVRTVMKTLRFWSNKTESWTALIGTVVAHAVCIQISGKPVADAAGHVCPVGNNSADAQDCVRQFFCPCVKAKAECLVILYNNETVSSSTPDDSERYPAPFTEFFTRHFGCVSDFLDIYYGRSCLPCRFDSFFQSEFAQFITFFYLARKGMSQSVFIS